MEIYNLLWSMVMDKSSVLCGIEPSFLCAFSLAHVCKCPRSSIDLQHWRTTGEAFANAQAADIFGFPSFWPPHLSLAAGLLSTPKHAFPAPSDSMQTFLYPPLLPGCSPFLHPSPPQGLILPTCHPPSVSVRIHQSPLPSHTQTQRPPGNVIVSLIMHLIQL